MNALTSETENIMFVQTIGKKNKMICQKCKNLMMPYNKGWKCPICGEVTY